MVESLITLDRPAELLSRLDRKEAERLARLEAVVKEGLQTFAEVGAALLEIRDGRLYRATHVSFGSYCRERWGMTKTHAHRLIAGAEVVENIKLIGPAPVAESVVRPLVPLPPEEQKVVWAKVVERQPKAITANLVTRVINEIGSMPHRRPGPRQFRRTRGDRVSRQAVLGVLDNWKSLTRGGRKSLPKTIAVLRAAIEQL